MYRCVYVYIHLDNKNTKTIVRVKVPAARTKNCTYVQIHSFYVKIRNTLNNLRKITVLGPDQGQA